MRFRMPHPSCITFTKSVGTVAGTFPVTDRAEVRWSDGSEILGELKAILYEEADGFAIRYAVVELAGLALEIPCEPVTTRIFDRRRSSVFGDLGG